jgi:hypothetical protein
MMYKFQQGGFTAAMREHIKKTCQFITELGIGVDDELQHDGICNLLWTAPGNEKKQYPHGDEIWQDVVVSSLCFNLGARTQL